MALKQSCLIAHGAVLILSSEMVHVHKRLTLIILARDITWHVNGKTCLVEVVAASVDKSIGGAIVATMKQSGAAS